MQKSSPNLLLVSYLKIYKLDLHILPILRIFNVAEQSAMVLEAV